MANYIPGIDKTKKFLNDKIQPSVANILGISDEGKLAEKQARQSAQERMNMGIKNQDPYEDTLRHMLLGAYTTSEGGFDLGKRVGGSLINLRELGEGDEGKIDINNNNLGKIIAKFRLSKEGGELRGDALKEQIFEDAKMLSASVDTGNSSNQKQIREYLYGEGGLMHKLDNFLGSGKDINNIMPMLSTSGMNKGGMMDNQMVKAFAIGGEVTDPISGNEVPEGSFPNEVRDDVPAMLSEGEYVVPADVLRFYGLKFFEDLRGNAKMELTRMAQDGRMGGDPIQESQSLTDTDVTSLERMMRNANNGSKGDVVEMAKGGLIDKLAHTIRTDNGVNQRLARGGVVIKMAPGGLVSSSLYKDPTKMDAIIKEVTTASKTNPALYQRLASKGVVLDKTNATMDSKEMLKENRPKFNIETGKEIVRAAEGGLIGYNHGGYHGDLFSTDPFKKETESSTIDERYSNETGDIITKHYKLVDGIKMLTGYTRDSNPDRKFSIPPLEIPSGFNQLITTPTTELDNLNVTNENDRGLPDSADKNNDGIPDQSQVDTTAWSKEIDFNNPESVQGWIDSHQKSNFPGIIGIGTNIDREYKGGVIGSVTVNDTVKSMMEDYLSDFKTDKKSLTGKIKSFLTTLTPAQKNKYANLQLTNFPNPENAMLNDDTTGMKQKTIDAYTQFADSQSPTDNTNMSLGFGRTSPSQSPRGSSSSSEGEAPSSPSNDPSNPEGFVDKDTDFIDAPNPDNNNNETDYGNFAYYNKGGLASKKSKKGYNKGGYSTKKKMNTGGLVKKKKKK